MKKIAIVNSTYNDYLKDFLLEFEKDFSMDFIIFNYNKKITNISSKSFWSFDFIFQNISLRFPFYLFRKNYDVVISFGPTFFYTLIAHFIQKFRGKKHIIYNELWWESNHWKFKLFFPFVKYLLKNADGLIVPGSLQVDFLTKLGVNPSKITKGVYASKDLGKIKLDKNKIFQFSKITKCKKNTKKFLYFARIVPYKGLDLLIKAFARLEKENPNVELLITGNFDDDNYFRKCQALANKLKVSNIQFLGPNSSNWTLYFFNWCDIALFPVIYRPNDVVCGESWGLVVNEAMSLSKFTIGSDAMASSVDMIDDGKTGFLIKQGSINDLYLKMKDSLKLKIDKDLIRKKIDDEYSHKEMFKAFKLAIKKL